MEQGSALKSILCTPCYDIYTSGDGWSVVRYTEKDTGRKFNASGDNIPKTKDLCVLLTGSWEISRKDGSRVFSVSYYDIPKTTSRDGIVSYLQSVKCRIGPKKANLIYDTFGEDTWQILDERPWELTKIPGISDRTVKAVKSARSDAVQLRKLIMLCSDAKTDIPQHVLRKVISEYGDRTFDSVSYNPYLLADYKISFSNCDHLAKHLGISDDFEPRLEQGIRSVFRKAGMNGHVCMPKTDITVNGKNFRGLVYELSKVLGNEELFCRSAINTIWKTGKLRSANGYLYMTESYLEEESIAKNMRKFFLPERCGTEQIVNIISDYEKENFTLARSQREAVKMVFENPVSVITGVPGSGKTTVIKAILYVHEHVYGNSSEPVLLAPTGKAARRMSEATGHIASTVHSAIGYHGEEVPPDPSVTITGNIVIIDESSMIDQRITATLLDKIRADTRIVFVGDVNQLPSVGPGNILLDIIRSCAVPVTALDVIYRQNGTSPIITNADKMIHGDTDLVFDRTFYLFETDSDDETVARTKEVYLKCVRKYGIDNVILLNPQRQNTSVSVGAFNRDLQQILHSDSWRSFLCSEPGGDEMTVRIGNTDFRTGDRIIQLKNTDDARNGDIGIIRNIRKKNDPDDPQTVIYFADIEFNDDGTLHEYTVEMMRNIELAYATTVHKAQGSEYLCVVEVISNAHPSMLKRQIVYTGITRAKKYVYLVGQKSALETAISHGEPTLRHTLLSNRLHNCS